MAIELGDAIWRIGGDDSKLRNTLKNATRAVGAAASAAGVAVLALGVKSVNAFADIGDEIGKMAKRTGLSTEELSRLRNAADLSDTSMKSLGKGVSKMAGLLNDAGAGMASATDIMDSLGLSIEKSFIGQNPDEVFNTFVEAIAGVEDPLMRAAIAEDVFGRAGREMLPMLAGGIEEFRKMKAATRDVFSKEDTDAAEAYKDTWTELSKVWESAQIIIAKTLLPSFQGFLSTIVVWLDVALAWTKSNQGLVATIVKVAFAVGGLLALLGPGMLIATFGVVAAKVMLVVGVLGALGFALFKAIGGWKGVGEVITWVANITASAREWLAVNWGQIVTIFWLAKDSILLALKIWWEGLKAIAINVFNIMDAMSGGFFRGFGGMEDATSDGTSNMLDTLESFLNRVNGILTRVLGRMQLFVLDLEAKWLRVSWILNAIREASAFIPGLGLAGQIGGPVGLATGGSVSQAGWAVVGERGPELVNLPGGSTVFDAQQTSQAGGGGNTLNLHFGKDSVRTDEDIRQIERQVSNIIHGELSAAGLRL